MLRRPLCTQLKLRNLHGANIHGLGQRVEVLFQQGEAHLCVGGVVPAVVEFAGVFFQVKQFALGAVVVADQLVATGRGSSCRRCLGDARGPGRLGLGRGSIRCGRRRGASGFGRSAAATASVPCILPGAGTSASSSKVGAMSISSTSASQTRPSCTRPGQEQIKWYSHQALVKPAPLAHELVVAQQLAVIRRENYEGVLALAAFF